jgi:hypothetical protein
MTHVTAQTTRSIIGVALLTGFLIAFTPDVTGIDVHQVLGCALAGLAASHGWIHRHWIASIARRLGQATAVRGQLYWLLDAALAAGFALIVGTGLLISTWFGYTGEDLAFWIDVHVIGSMVSLALVLAKVATHWRWFIRVTAPVRRERPHAPRAAAASGPSRRAFLGLMGTVGAATIAAGLSAMTRFDQKAAAQVSGSTEASDPVVPNAAPSSATASARASVTEASTATETAAPAVSTATATETAAPAVATATVTANAAASSAPACQVRCDRGCSYPGRCRKYADANGNGLCDRGECL